MMLPVVFNVLSNLLVLLKEVLKLLADLLAKPNDEDKLVLEALAALAEVF